MNDAKNPVNIITNSPETARLFTHDMAFLGVHDIDLDSGITKPYSSEAELISIMIQRCRKKIVLADHSKFGRVSLSRVECEYGDIDTIVTDEGIERNGRP